MSILDSTKEFFGNAFNLYKKPYQGMVDVNKRLENQTLPDEKVNELFELKKNQIDYMKENQSGYLDYLAEKQFGPEGATDPYDVGIGSSYDKYVNTIEDTRGLVIAENLTNDSKYDVLSKATVMGVADAGAFILSMLDGPGGLLQFERMSNAVRNNKYVDLKHSINKENLAQLLGKSVDELTEQNLRDAEAQIYKLHEMSHLGYGLGTIGSFPGEDILLRGAFKAFTAGGKLALTNPKTTAAGTAIATGTTTTDAEASTRSKTINYATDLGKVDKAAKQSEVDKAIADFMANKKKTTVEPSTKTTPVATGTTLVRGKNVPTANLNKAAQMGYGVNWNQLSKSQIDHLLDPGFRPGRNKTGIGPKIDLETGEINPKWTPTQNKPKYNGTREADIAYTKELDKAAAYVSLSLIHI